MLFHPYRPKKIFGITFWPQGMIPRHRARLAQSIGNAVGNELVSQETVFDALFETSFFQRKIEDFVESYTQELLSNVYPSFIEALPTAARGPVLETIAELKHRMAEYIAELLKSDETSAAVSSYVDRQIDHHCLLVSEFQLASIRIATDDPHVDAMLADRRGRLGCKDLQCGHRQPGYSCFHHQRLPLSGILDSTGQRWMVVPNGDSKPARAIA